eukprot:11184101-Lingulodinium_polyedra.AAC.1
MFRKTTTANTNYRIRLPGRARARYACPHQGDNTGPPPCQLYMAPSDRLPVATQISTPQASGQ